MSYAPCKNPNCKSYGQPHPNCRCYGGYAKGGEISFCLGDRSHEAGCQYFVDGGQVQPAGFIPDGEFQPATEQPNYQGVPGFISDDDFVSDSNKYETIGQQILTGVEGAAQGVLGPIATAAEFGLSELGVSGLSSEDINGRQKANPGIHGTLEATALGLSAYLSAGAEPAAIHGLSIAVGAAKAASKAAEFANMGKIGSAVIRGAISNGIIQGGDEVSSWMLGKGDPQDPVGSALAHMGVAGLIGGALGGAAQLALSTAKASLEGIAEKQFGQKSQYFLNGLASAMNNAPDETKILSGISKKSYIDGRKFFDALTSKASASVAGAAFEAYRGHGEGDFLENAAKGALEGLLIKKAAGVASKSIAPAMLKVLSSDNISGAFQALDYAADIARGSKAIDKSIESLFKASAVTSQQLTNAYAKDQKKADKIDSYLKRGGVDQEIQEALYNMQNPNPQGFAEGGDVAPMTEAAPDGIAMHYPEQNIVLNSAKARISQYLNGLRPQENSMKLPFDPRPDLSAQDKSYRRALDVAVSPLSVIDEIQKGTIDPEHVKHFNAMFPETSNLLQRRITEKVMSTQLAGERPPYKIRQGLSMFLGAALSSELTPEGINAAQSVFAQKDPQQQAPQQSAPSKSSGAKLTKSEQAYLTNPQALTKRAQKA